MTGDDVVIRNLTHRAICADRDVILYGVIACSNHDDTIFNDDDVILDHDVVIEDRVDGVMRGPNVIDSHAIVIGNHDVVT